MKKVEDLLFYLRSLNVKIWADGDRLRYNAPKGALEPALRAELVDRKAEILEFLHKANIALHSTLPQIQRVPRDATLPLSFAQERLWFLDQLEANSPAYNIPAILRLTGRLDAPAMNRSLTEIVRRHEVLRTTFPPASRGTVQMIAPPHVVNMPVVDLRHLPEPQRSFEIKRLTDEEAQRPFNLAAGPLLRVTLLRLAEDSHVFLLTMHHIVSDGWSLGIFIRELSALYEAFSKGAPCPLPELPIQYADFAHWQRKWLAGETLDTQLSYWKRQLNGMPSLLTLPTDRPRPPVQSYRAATEYFEINADLTQRLKTLSERSGATLFMTLLAAYAILLSRYSGQKDIAIGSPIANRNRSELERLIGFFVNTLVLRIDIKKNPTLQELLGIVRQIALDAYAHQDLPFEKLVAELQPERNLSFFPLFQAMFIMQNAPMGNLEIRGMQLTSLEMEIGVVRCDLSLSIEVTEQRLKGLWTYKPDLFNASTIARMSGRFQMLLENITRNPGVKVSDLETDQAIELPLIQPSANDVEKAPLSYHQERLWFIDQFETGNVYESSPTYHNVPAILHLKGHVDRDALEQSLNTIIERHQALRTRFIPEGDAVFQVMSPCDTLKLNVVDVGDDLSGAADDRAPELIFDYARRPFALDRDLLVRAGLFIISDDESLLAVIVHHIVADKWSMRLIVEELKEIYSARVAGATMRLPKAILQYRDYSYWQSNLPESVLEPLLFYWKHQLGGKLQAIELPSDRLRPAVHTFTEARHTFFLDAELAKRISALSEAERSCDFNVLLTCFKVLLHRYAAQDEIIVGVSEPCRNHPGVENIIGAIANLLVIRSNLAENPTFRSLLAQVDRTINHARNHKEMPFDRLVRELNPEKDMSRTALFDILFQFEDQPPPVFEMAGVKARVIETNSGYGKYDINLSIHRTDNGLSGIAVYNADIYDRFTIDQMMRHFGRVLESVVFDPDQRIDDIALLSKSEEYQQILAWNSTEALYPYDKTIHYLFEEQVRRTPDKIAVRCEDRRLSYGELDEQANRLAHYLRQNGVAPNTLVALCLDRSVEMIVAMLGVLKAGGAYLPMEPSFPQQRLRFIIDDAKVLHIITKKIFLSKALDDIPHIILLDENSENISKQPSTALLRNTSPEDLAYCIYTSGSTGQPKGVLLQHRNVVRLLVNDKPQFAFSEKDVWTMFHSYCFDFSVWEMYGALLYGGEVVIVPTDVTKDPALFLNLLVDYKVTVLNQTPTFFYALAKEALKDGRPELALRYVIFGGEALNPIQLKEWKSSYPGVKLINMYGITETTVHVTFKEINDVEIEGNTSNIGRPISTTTAYVMDSNLRLLPVGVPGELCVGGDGVGRGYLGREELTQEKFVPNPYKPGERLYRSGDLAKLLPNGEMVYLGRLDDQVQVRGFRVELGEIQNNLLKHPDIVDAVVVARQDHSGAAEVVAYIVPSSSFTSAARKLFGPDAGDALSYKPRYELPNGLEVFYQNKNETEFLYQEIFEDKTYFKHGITINEGDCIFDVGANIGLFTLFVGQTFKDVVIYAFEPIPSTFEILRLNAELYGLKAKLFQCGIANETKREVFTYYPHISIFSGRFADTEEERKVIKSFLINQQLQATGEAALAGEELDEIVLGRLTAEQVICDLRSLSDVIRENGVEQIDLLKIDVEKSELDLLAGIEADDWPKIKQLVMEVHDVDNRLGQIKSIIEGHGFDLIIEQDDCFKDTSNYNIYAVRQAMNQRVLPEAFEGRIPEEKPLWTSSSRLVKDVRNFLKENLPEYMIPSAFVLLDKLPVTSNGKVDRRALPAPDYAGYVSQQAMVAPRTPVERQIAAIWEEVLGLDQVGAHNNFFELGGHSLIATQVISRLRDAFSVTLPVRSLFESPTVAGLAQVIENDLASNARSDEPQLVSVARESRRAKLSSINKENLNLSFNK